MKLIFLVVLSVSTLMVEAFDQTRKGVFFQAGVGASLLESKLSLNGNISQSSQDTGGLTQLRFGSGVVNKLALLSELSQRVYFGQDAQESYYITDVGVGSQYYFTSYIKTAYIFGLASTALSKFGEESFNIGRSFKLGLGYQWSRNWQAEVTWLDTDSKISHTQYDYLQSQGVQLTLNYLWY